MAAASQPSHALQHARFRFIARLSPANIVSTTNGNTTTVSTPTAGTIIFQLTPDGKTTNVAGDLSSVSSSTSSTTKLGVTSPASGTVSFQVSPDGKSINVIGTLSKISNVSVIDLHEASKGSNGPTVAVLLSPGSGSGPTPLKPFRTAIKAPFLTGPLTGHSLRSLVMAMRSGTIYVLVQTSNGVDPSSAAACAWQLPLW